MAPECSTELHATVDEIRAGDCTTLVLHGVPNQCNCEGMLALFAKLGFASDLVDYMYMPFQGSQASRQKSLGYMFVNLIDPELACRFCVAVHGASFTAQNSSKSVFASPTNGTCASSGGHAMADPAATRCSGVRSRRVACAASAFIWMMVSRSHIGQGDDSPNSSSIRLGSGVEPLVRQKP